MRRWRYRSIWEVIGVHKVGCQWSNQRLRSAITDQIWGSNQAEVDILLLMLVIATPDRLVSDCTGCARVGCWVFATCGSRQPSEVVTAIRWLANVSPVHVERLLSLSTYVPRWSLQRNNTLALSQKIEFIEKPAWKGLYRFSSCIKIKIVSILKYHINNKILRKTWKYGLER